MLDNQSWIKARIDDLQGFQQARRPYIVILKEYIWPNTVVSPSYSFTFG